MLFEDVCELPSMQVDVCNKTNEEFMSYYSANEDTFLTEISQCYSFNEDYADSSDYIDPGDLTCFHLCKEGNFELFLLMIF